MRYLRWFGRVVRPYAMQMTFMMMCHLLHAVCTIVFVYASKKLIDTAVSIFSGHPRENDIYVWAGVLVGIIVLRIGLNAYKSYLQTRIDIRIKNGLRRRLFDTLLHVQVNGAQTRHSGDILNRIQEDVRVVSSVISVSLPNLIGAVLQFLAAFSVLLFLDYRLSLLILIIVPLGILFGRFVSNRIRKLTLEIRDKDSKVQSHLQESVQHLILLQTMEYSSTSSSELAGLQGDLYASEIRRTKFSIVSRIFISLAFQAGYFIAFMWGVLGISHGTVTYGMMTAFLQLVGQIQRPLLDMTSHIPSIIHSTASIDRIVDIEELPQEELVDPVMMDGTAGVRLRDVTFAYPDSKRNIFEDFSFDFTPGSRTAIVGPTGVGKSTLIRMLLALLKPQSGDISVYADNEGQMRSEQVSPATRCNLVYVPQGNSLFSGTIRENLCMGNPDATEQQLVNALHTAAADFVFELPDGLDSQCREGGVGLSEGQAQRIAIARALLRPGSILLLDEFSSALDAQTEELLMERLTSTLSDHTMIFITHREKIIDYCTTTLRL